MDHVIKLSTEQRKIYMDANATTPLWPGLKDQYKDMLGFWGNASSIHWAGQKAKSLIREARHHLSQALRVQPLELVFTSGASEANSTVVRGFWEFITTEHFRLKGRREFITTTVEHPSIKKALLWIQTLGFPVHYVPVSKNGQLDLEYYDQVLSEKTALVTMMMAHNETGVIFPIQKLAKKAHEKGAFFHTDAVQAYGKILTNLNAFEVDYASISSHKFYGLKGAGCLFVRKGSPYTSLIFGGGQERNRRGGTENDLSIWSMGAMAEVLEGSLVEKNQSVVQLRNYLEKRLIEEIPGIDIPTQTAKRLPNTSNIIVDQVDGEVLMMTLDLKGVAVSTGAACSSGAPYPSESLMAMGYSSEEAQSSIRISLNWLNTKEEVDELVNIMKNEIHRLRQLVDDPYRPFFNRSEQHDIEV